VAKTQMFPQRGSSSDCSSCKRIDGVFADFLAFQADLPGPQSAGHQR